ncbi:glucosyl-3-phosphoglycerate synthase [Methanolobus chelungpuianus]|uniref:Glucosyl-3-phosphoglycerate synthase n=1 Tax=Methanolobus chelungpuianus TaxID=502115 RepID=A0AAE3HB33_9EURY|nr:glucosyl-3-phosphoglycerate synthase [Methanolobus chelungpuianus]MCQ6962853.1 glucosyl-3-phosphoglycerate synthase [Methanolobus chelungpuianus]
MDFFQEKITTIHNFYSDTDRMLQHLQELSFVRPAVVVLPMLYSEIENPPLPRIIDELNKCTFLKKVVVALAADNREQYRTVVDFFERLELDHLIVWCNGSRISSVIEEMKENELDITGFSGKGKDAWISLGIASLYSYAIVLHDADIINYNKEFVAKLLYPIVHPQLNFYFNKGYYARINLEKKTMHGRVYRLFVRPLLDTLMRDVKYESDILEYMQAFRYTLSGEFAFTRDLALNIRIPSDWGLEVGMLAEIYRNTSLKRVCQTDLGFYDHKHKELGTNPSEGLTKMVNDIMVTFLRVVNETTSTQVSTSFLRGIQVKYRRSAQDLIRQYHADAVCNGLEYSRHLEERYVEIFAETLMLAGTQYLKDPSGALLPDWARALSAIPDLREQLRDAAHADLEEVIRNRA